MNQNRELFVEEMSIRIRSAQISKENQDELINQLVMNVSELESEEEFIVFKDNYHSMVDELIGQYPHVDEIVVLTEMNNEMHKLIQDENRDTYVDLMLYLRGSNIDDIEQESIRSDLIRMILDAQERGDSIERLIGNNPKDFMDSIIDSFQQKSLKIRLLEYSIISIKGLLIIFSIISIFWFVGELLENQASNFNIPISVGDLLSMILLIILSFMVIDYLTKNPFKSNRRKQGLIVIIGFILTVLFTTAMPVLFPTVLFRINFFVGFIVLLLILVSLQLIYQRVLQSKRSSN